MEQSRQGLSQRERNKQFIIKSKRKLWREFIVIFFSLLVWGYCISVIYFFVDALFALNHSFPRLLRIIFKMNTEDVRSFTFLTLLMFIIIYILLYSWSLYNKKRFGNLNRRKNTSPATKIDMMSLNMIDESIYDELQNIKEISFEKNPVKRKEK